MFTPSCGLFNPEHAMVAGLAVTAHTFTATYCFHIDLTYIFIRLALEGYKISNALIVRMVRMAGCCVSTAAAAVAVTFFYVIYEHSTLPHPH